MGDSGHRSVRRTAAALVVTVAAVAAVTVAALRPDEQERFRSWLLDQPGIVAVRPADRAAASGPVAARVFEPSLSATVRDPLSAALVERLGSGIVAYAAQHPAVSGSTVQLRQGEDTVLVSTEEQHNTMTLQALTGLRALPDLVSVTVTLRSGGTGTLAATVRAGTDLPGTLSTITRAVPASSRSWATGPAPVVVRDDGVGNQVRSEDGALPSASAAGAFRLAVREDPDHAATLVARTADRGARQVITLAPSPALARTAAALHRSGFGLRARHELVTGPRGELPMDERAWADGVEAHLLRQNGIRAAQVDPGDDGEGSTGARPIQADLRIVPDIDLARLFPGIPTTVERVEVHTAPHAPDYARDDALAPDPEVDCPTSGSAMNLAYSGPREAVPEAANYVAALRAAPSEATCVHWAERGVRGRPQSQVVLIRLPLRESSWRPVLDVVRARRADLGSAHPDVVLLLPVPGRSWTAVFNLAEGDAPYGTALGTEGQAEDRRVEDMLQPLVRYWARG